MAESRQPSSQPKSLPKHIYVALQILSLLSDRSDPKGNQEYHDRISALLSKEIEKFDREIGRAVTALCKDPRKPFTENCTQIRKLTTKTTKD
jgi:pyruvate dehydrogenase phosphatase